jgi:hypothetical protein
MVLTVVRIHVGARILICAQLETEKHLYIFKSAVIISGMKSVNLNACS